MWIYLVQGFGFGFAAAAQPGPFQTYLISQSLLRGWRRTLIAAFAPLVSDAPIIALCVFALSRIPPWFERALNFASGAFILYLAFGAYRSWRAFKGAGMENEAGAGQGLVRAAFVNVISPGPYLFWSLITGPILIKGWREIPAFGVSLLAGFYSTFILSLMLIIILFGTIQQLGAKVQRAMLGLSAIALFCFGLYQLWMGVTFNQA
jgi:threonine/homoserine/homoserine lactone efflux protein